MSGIKRSTSSYLVHIKPEQMKKDPKLQTNAMFLRFFKRNAKQRHVVTVPGRIVCVEPAFSTERHGERGQNKQVPFHEIGLKFDGHEIRRRRRRRVIPSSTTTWCLMGWGHVCCTRAPLTVSPCVFTRAPTAHLSPALDATLPPPRLGPRPWPSFCSHPRLRLTRTSSDNRKQSTNHHPLQPSF
jgi:hypothetical protein